MREFFARRDWVQERVRDADALTDLLCDSASEMRDVPFLARERYRAELEGLMTGLRNAVWVNGLPETLENVEGFAKEIQDADAGMETINDFSFHRGRVETYLTSHALLAKWLGWKGDVAEEVRSLHPLRAHLKRITPEQEGKIGMLLGYPEESIRGYVREMRIREGTEIPAPQHFFQIPGRIKKLSEFRRDDFVIIDAAESYKRVETARILGMPERDRMREQGRLQEQLYERVRPHLSRWYQTYFNVRPSDAEHLASKRRVELYLGNAAAPAVDFGAYGPPSEEEETLKRSAKEISSHM